MREVYKDATSQTQYVVLRSSTTGLAATGKVYTDITGSYTRSRSARAAITMATLASASAAWSSGGFILVDDTNCPGLYRFDVPDAAFATGVDRVIISLKATGVLDEHLEVVLVNWNKQVGSIPNAAAEAAGGLYTRGTGPGQINQAADGMIDTNPVRLNNVSQSLLDLKDFADDGYDPSTNKVQGLVLADAVTAVSAGGITAASIGADAFTAAKFAADVGVEFADALLDRDMATGADSGSPTVRTVRQALRALRNRFGLVGTTRSVYKEDDVTASWTSVVTTSPTADPIIADDPA